MLIKIKLILFQLSLAIPNLIICFTDIAHAIVKS